MPLAGKRILITGGAGFIGTTLARRLVDANEIVAFDNLHRDARPGTDLARAPELHASSRATCSTRRRCASAAAGATHVVHCGRDRRRRHRAREPRADDAREPDRHLQRARGRARDCRDRRAVRRLLHERGLRHARVQRPARANVTTIGSVGEARWTYAVSKLAGEHMAHAYHDELGLPTATVRPFNVYGPGPDRRRRDPRLHRGRARRPRPDDPRRRLADPRLVLRRRHGRRRAPLPRAARGRRAHVQHRQRPLDGDDLRPRPAGQAAHRLPGRDRVHSRCTTPTSSSASPTSTKARELLGFEARGRPRRGPRAHDRVVPRHGSRR